MDRISYKGYNNNYATFKASGNVNFKAGDFVSINDDGACVKSASGDGILGVCAGARNGYVTVQLQGYTEAKFTGEISAFGLYRLKCGANGTVVSAGANDVVPFVKIVMIDDTNSIVGFIF